MIVLQIPEAVSLTAASISPGESYFSKYQSISCPDTNFPSSMRGFVGSVFSSNAADGTNDWGCCGLCRLLDNEKAAPFVTGGN